MAKKAVGAKDKGYKCKECKQVFRPQDMLWDGTCYFCFYGGKHRGKTREEAQIG